MTLGEITREEQRKALEEIRKMEGRERERARGIDRRGNLIWVPTLRTSSGVRFGYWRKAREGEIMREFKIWGGSVNELRGL